ncbi:MAG: deoxyribodipyrimidine photolyase [Deltaproteobacteria bacterium]|nr:deoxyribodipyrimidine photolyase [Deltaproteobacteria bacterium]
MIPATPKIRVTAGNDAPLRADADHVVYWMIAARRTRWSFGLQHAISQAQGLGLPLIVLEPLRVGYRHASARLHAFVVDGMADQAARFDGTPVAYHPYLEPEDGADKGLLAALAERAALVVTDEFPCFFLPRMVRAAASKLPCRLELVDGNGLMPLRASDRWFPTAYAFRRHLQKELPRHLDAFPLADPLSAARGLPKATVPADVAKRWPAVDARALAERDRALVTALPIDQDVGVAELVGGEGAGREAMTAFVKAKLRRYSEDRNEPDGDATSGLSPYLHFGQVSAHEVARAVMDAEGWHESKLSSDPKGARAGWWGMSEPAEAFLDQLVTWRELGYGFCHHRPDDYDTYASLPDWARETLGEHATDERPWLYDLDALEGGDTHDELWNAAQNQLRATGTMHNYLRMLWGKKILHWTKSPEVALDIMITLNDRYALDGRDPNSYSGMLWCLGRFDRPWGPEREVFGKIRYMTSDNTARKLHVKDFVKRWA